MYDVIKKSLQTIASYYISENRWEKNFFGQKLFVFLHGKRYHKKI